jgi:hypothetical protein
VYSDLQCTICHCIFFFFPLQVLPKWGEIASSFEPNWSYFVPFNALLATYNEV